MRTDVTDTYLRRAERDDAHDLARLRAASLAEQNLLPPADAATFAFDAERRFAALFRDGRIAGWVLVARGGIRGAACSIFWERLPYAGTSLHAELAGVYVEPAFRRCGYARELCREALDDARASGARRITVHPSASGAPLYRELGFVTGNEMLLGRRAV
jgi:ribosomal protein S18 acetylase RimI-like enzyme